VKVINVSIIILQGSNDTMQPQLHEYFDIPKPENSQQIKWQDFDVVNYLKKTWVQPNEDPFLKYKYNQTASDLLPMNRDIPDFRHPEFVCRHVNIPQSLIYLRITASALFFTFV
jgi:hypothetical protein